MELINPGDLKLVMRLAGLKPNKGLGQNFLVDQGSLAQIVAAAELKPGDVVLEVGPGAGTMTGLLLDQVKGVVAVETDPELAELLRRAGADNLEVVEQDFLEYDLRQMPPGYKVVANIPYYLTSKIFRLLLESSNPPRAMILLVQREVAERVVAGPGKLSILALSVQYYARAELVGVVDRHKFWPAPKVDSAILRITRRKQPVFAAEPAKLFRLIKAGFGEKRKQLKNSLAGGLNVTPEYAAQVLHAAEIPVEARAQELTLPDWERLYRACLKVNLLD